MGLGMRSFDLTRQINSPCRRLANNPPVTEEPLIIQFPVPYYTYVDPGS